MTMRDYKISALADTDMRQYEFTRNSRLARGTFDTDRWYQHQDRIVFVVCAALLLALLLGIVQ